jgi:hypothetical protein
LIGFQAVNVSIDDRKGLQAAEKHKVDQAEQHGKVDDDGFENEQLEGLEDDEADEIQRPTIRVKAKRKKARLTGKRR